VHKDVNVNVLPPTPTTPNGFGSGGFSFFSFLTIFSFFFFPFCLLFLLDCDKNNADLIQIEFYPDGSQQQSSSTSSPPLSPSSHQSPLSRARSRSRQNLGKAPPPPSRPLPLPPLQTSAPPSQTRTTERVSVVLRLLSVIRFC
jgi:hypothetical protein